MRRGSLLAGLRPREDESETELDGEEAPESEPKPAKKRSTPAETRALDARIFEASDLLAEKLGRAPTLPEIADAARVPGTSNDARRVRVAKALLRRRGLLTPKPAPTKAKAKAVRAPAPAPARPAVALTLIEALVAERARLAGIVARLDATIADLGGTA